MLRPRTIFERSAKALTVLRLIGRYRSLPSGIIVAALSDHNVVSLTHGPMRDLVRERFLKCATGKARHGSTHVFTITAKGRRALKEHTGKK
jgi:uncharacterized membrane protein